MIVRCGPGRQAEPLDRSDVEVTVKICPAAAPRDGNARRQPPDRRAACHPPRQIIARRRIGRPACRCNAIRKCSASGLSQRQSKRPAITSAIDSVISEFSSYSLASSSPPLPARHNIRLAYRSSWSVSAAKHFGSPDPRPRPDGPSQLPTPPPATVAECHAHGLAWACGQASCPRRAVGMAPCNSWRLPCVPSCALAFTIPPQPCLCRVHAAETPQRRDDQPIRRQQ